MKRLHICSLLFVAALCCALFLQLAQADSNCPKPCPHILDPVCTTDGSDIKRFSNRCLMEAHNQCESENGRSFHEIESSHCGSDEDFWASL